MPYVNLDPRAPARINSGVGDYVDDPRGGNQSESDLNYSVAPINVLTLAPLPADPLQRGAWGSGLNGCGCGCPDGLGDLSSSIASLASSPTSLLLAAGGALAIGYLLFGRKSGQGRRKALRRERYKYLSKKFALEAA